MHKVQGELYNYDLFENYTDHFLSLYVTFLKEMTDNYFGYTPNIKQYGQMKNCNTLYYQVLYYTIYAQYKSESITLNLTSANQMTLGKSLLHYAKCN
jgi:hypothetical protein